MFNTLTKLIMDEQEIFNQIKELQKQRTSLKEQDNLLAVQIIGLIDKLRRDGIKKGYYTNNCNLFCKVCNIKNNIIDKTGGRVCQAAVKNSLQTAFL